LDLQDGTLTVVVTTVVVAPVVVAPVVMDAVVVGTVVLSIHNYENRLVNNMKGCERILLNVDDSVVLVELIIVADAIQTQVNEIKSDKFRRLPVVLVVACSLSCIFGIKIPAVIPPPTNNSNSKSKRMQHNRE
jgi:hypothetical protein